MKFGTNASSTSTNDRAKFRPNLMYRLRMPTDMRQTHNATIAGLPAIAGLPPIAGCRFCPLIGRSFHHELPAYTADVSGRATVAIAHPTMYNMWGRSRDGGEAFVGPTLHRGKKRPRNASGSIL